MLIVRESLFFLGSRLGLLLMSLLHFISNNIRQKLPLKEAHGLIQSMALLVASSVKGASISSLSLSNCLFTPSVLCKLKGLLGEADQMYCTRLCLAQEDTALGWSFLARQ